MASGILATLAFKGRGIIPASRSSGPWDGGSRTAAQGRKVCSHASS